MEKESNSAYWHQVCDRHVSAQIKRGANERLEMSGLTVRPCPLPGASGTAAAERPGGQLQ